MKNIIWAVIAAALIFTGTESFARGFSVGVFGAYSIDGGAIEDSIKEKRFMDYHPDNPLITKSEYDTVIMPGAGVFAIYQFSNGMFIRAGAEYYRLVSGGDVSKSVHEYTFGTTNYDYTIEYEAIAWPVMFGFSLSPDKGRTSLYIASGIISSLVKIRRETYTSYNGYTYESDNESIITGFAGLLGAEKRHQVSPQVLFL